MMGATVERLRLTAVKGLPQHEVDALDLVPGGIVDDRRLAIVDDAGRVLYSADLDVLAGASAAWLPAGPSTGDLLPVGTLELRFADGETVAGGVTLGEPLAARAYADRPVPGRLVTGPFAAALSRRVELPLRLLFVDAGVGSPQPITILGDGSVSRLARELALDRLDPRRFRTSIEVSGLGPHEEDRWQGSRVRIGGAVVRIRGPVPRCVLVTRDPQTRARDHDVLRAILGYRERMPTGEAPFGVYAAVDRPGRVRVGDPVVPLSR